VTDRNPSVAQRMATPVRKLLKRRRWLAAGAAARASETEEPQALRAFAAGVAEQEVEGNGAALRKPAESRRPKDYDAMCDFAQLPGWQNVLAQIERVAALGIENPYFRVNEGIAAGTTTIEGKEFVNFANYNYLGLAGDPRVSQAAKDAIDRYGTSVSASRIASGERPVQGELERAIAELYGVEAALVFVGGHATNVTTISHLIGRHDLVVYDSLAHNSAVQGTLLTMGRRMTFPHNDWEALDRLLSKHRTSYERTLVYIEGVYSMDGDIPDLPRFLEVKRRHKTWLMIDEAHSLGVLGAHGGGLGEHYGIAGPEVDIWMGTLSKTTASCGGFIAGCTPLVQYLRYTAPGFVYSVGMSPPNAASALAALKLMQAEPERVARLSDRGALFLELARARGLDTGKSRGSAVVPVMVGDEMLCLRLSNVLYSRGINVQPIIYPGVPVGTARLRFFISAAHTEEQIRRTVEACSEELERLRREFSS
jgi:8-amino-7-oxononanoate synthase